MAHILGMKVIAAGIETVVQVQFFLEKKADYLQGFLFAKPMHRTEFLNLLVEEGSSIPVTKSPAS